MFIFVRVAVALVATTAFIAAWQLAQLIIPDEVGVPFIILILGGLTGTLGYLVKQASDNRADNRVAKQALLEIQRRLDAVDRHLENIGPRR